MRDIEKAGCPDTAHTRCQVVTLYQGGQYKLYTYRKYSDVRLVFAPGVQIAFFGGDPGQFQLPALRPRLRLRAPVREWRAGDDAGPPQWNARAPTAGEPVFVAGNPGGTDRLLTWRSSRRSAN